MTVLNSGVSVSNGTRVWLSVSVPDGASQAEVESIQKFVGEFDRMVFESGGSIIHGSHPQIVWDVKDGWPASTLSNIHKRERRPNQYGKLPEGVLDVTWSDVGQLLTIGRDKKLRH